MSRFEELARLKEQEAKAKPAEIGISRILYENGNHLLQLHAPGDRFGKTNFGATHDQAALLASLRNAAPWLLQIAEAFQPGDAERLALLVLNEQQRWTDDRWQAAIDCLRRLQAACEEMER